ncbi:MAG: hypothetical protein WBQ89_14290 [Candidatus Acidiferrum sp.]
MKELPKDEQVNCEWFLNELEGFPPDESRGATTEVLRTRLPEEARVHAARCAECGRALEDLAVTRRALEGMEEGFPEAGPWFTRRVMQAIGAREEEIDEKQNGFWSNVRRLAPRLVAFATLLLMLGGTWAFEEHRAARSRGPEMRPSEGIFESLPSTPVNDDVIASAYEERLP